MSEKISEKIVIGQDVCTDEHFIAYGKKAYMLPCTCDAFILTFSSSEGIEAAKSGDVKKIWKLIEQNEQYVKNHPNYMELLDELNKLVEKIPFPIKMVDVHEEFEEVVE